MPVQVYVDESGGKGQGRYFVMAGLVAHSEHWARFSDEWQACLGRQPALRYFKMREAANCTGQFNGLSPAERDAKILELAQIINRWAKFGTISAIDLDAHAETWAITQGKPLNEPYFFPFHNTIMASCFELWKLGWRERFEIIFDEHVIFGPRAKAWYPAVLDIVQLREPEAHRIMPVDPLFRSDTECLPIQACDMVAGMNRQLSINPNDGQFLWLAEETNKVYTSDFSQFYDRARMEAVQEESHRLLREGGIPIEMINKHREHFAKKNS